MGLPVVGLRGRRRGLRGSCWAGGAGGGAVGVAPGALGVGQRGRTRGTTGRRRWGLRGGAGGGRATVLVGLGVGGGEREGGAV